MPAAGPEAERSMWVLVIGEGAVVLGAAVQASMRCAMQSISQNWRGVRRFVPSQKHKKCNAAGKVS